jgi:death on curing protein
MIELSTVLSLHERAIDKYGGSKGIRDKGALLAALARPYATFDLKDLYPTPADKAAAIFESIIINHPFLDGNKRIAYILLRVVLYKSGFDIVSSLEEKYQMTIASSTGQMRMDEIRQWIESKIIKAQE